ncbi:uncharacterized protein HD556DRAFT_470258 [Suillus plorans]|uniref:Uncharacterized protein n=1 Tax=Suillus plorans TaxID=116603 RepID=A0A9P7DW05_9AGAM|nr:uncharacterized protein HD556DRAFT_470258 [Suillus plorans]KAG1804683.1 hypothetical protein HD556DRAFT_470258 [Suillus plorans]
MSARALLCLTLFYLISMFLAHSPYQQTRQFPSISVFNTNTEITVAPLSSSRANVSLYITLNNIGVQHLYQSHECASEVSFCRCWFADGRSYFDHPWQHFSVLPTEDLPQILL